MTMPRTKRPRSRDTPPGAKFRVEQPTNDDAANEEAEVEGHAGQGLIADTHCHTDDPARVTRSIGGIVLP
jgi:hypothetical protein